MEEQKKKGELIEVKDKFLQKVTQRAIPKVVDGSKRVGKIAGWGSLAFISLGAIAVGNLPVATIGAASFLGTSARAIQNTLYKTEPSLMFMSRKGFHEIKIFQDVRLNLASKMRGYTNIEKGRNDGITDFSRIFTI